MKKTFLLVLLSAQLGFSQFANLDPTFAIGTGFQFYTGGSVVVNKSIVQPDGKIIIAGQYTNFNGVTISNIVRLNANGTKDTAFNPGTSTNAGIFDCALQSDGKIIIVGGFTSYNGTPKNRVARLNADGTLDTTFTTGTGPDDWIEETAIQADGKILIAGSFNNYNGTARSRVARINADGTLDTSFTVGTGADARVRTVAIQGDGKIVIGGDFNNFNGTASKRLARLNADGTLDTGFNIGTGALNNVRTIKIQADQQILIGGEFQAYNGVQRNRIARLNTDGTLDTGFTVGTGASGSVNSIDIQGDGKILIGGFFQMYNSTTRTNFARLNSDGSLDEDFTTGSGFDNSVSGITIQPDGKILVAGTFESYNGIIMNRLSRLTTETLGTESFAVNKLNLYPNPASTVLNLDAGSSYTIEKVVITDMTGKITTEQLTNTNQINIQHLAKGIYIITAYSAENKFQTKFIKE
jgi:uncharacterized delta-60 repeat protein